MTTANVYQPGDQVTVTFDVLNTATGLYYDPDVVRFHYTDPTGADYIKTYLTNSEVTRLSLGHFALVINVPYATSAVGTWYYDAQGLIASVSVVVEDNYFVVKSLPTLL